MIIAFNSVGATVFKVTNV